MYAHNIEGYRDIARLFDVFLARGPVFSIYIYAQIVLHRREEILEIDDSDILQVVLSKVPSNLDLEDVIPLAAKLFDRHPPSTLPWWKRISSASALKTAEKVEFSVKQTNEQGHEFFLRQSKEINWVETQQRVLKTLWTYRRPARAMGMAVAVGMLAFYLRRNPVVINHILSRFVR
jgi:hypothetical protein